MTFEQRQHNAIAEWKALDEKPCIYVGAATCGRASGALKLIESVNKELKKNRLAANMIEVGCIGLCYAEPLIDIAGADGVRVSYRNVTTEMIPQLINEHLINNNPVAALALGVVGSSKISGIPNLFDLPVLKPQERIALRNCGYIDPENINHYIASDGYRGLKRALKMSPDEVIEEVKISGLRGRGGAGFPTAVKWQFCRKAPGDEKYLICNADEGDPGAFMDRALLESDPHSVLEGMLIGAYAIGTTMGYIYIRSEYPLAITRLKIALGAMEDYGLLGDNILGSDFNFHIKVKIGAGAFVCGEETAMLFSIEGKRSVPRSRPPFPASSGLWGKPTNINNVETWANVSAIFDKSGEWYAGYGTEKSKGTKIFALAGKINNTGLIEVPMGITLGEIIYDIGGGIPDDKEFKAIQTGGPSGGCLPKAALDLPVDYEQLAAAGSIMGSGGMIVADTDTCMVDIARYFLTFTQNESCGKCVLCREGTMQMLEILTDITQGKGNSSDIERLLELAEAVKIGSLCALGGTAPNPVLTTIKYFRPEYETHINEKKCPARVCKALISFYVSPDKCKGCMACLKACPVGVIKGKSKMIHIINQEGCIRCGVCLDVCPPKFKAIAKVTGSLP
ncbi:NADH-quinone oxidoreductase subunit NuoF [candidate division NPL-UPA2 bacterium Unc8]|uniref:NADH-quinone oxidoreductase subunit NuoF n=1 Tax=candidate division NPL-UPA2 bacterium Unc8 TaxID=1980939 RepID=A0A399FW13_UNCN2|nr:NADP-reducing hydrogenase subunit HndC [Bacillota bacterium]RII00177.1 MAG: NADH-quinone oxidoreductase subunit NuoF [candidate division NPL-UPA2 bacterium Unc8]